MTNQPKPVDNKTLTERLDIHFALKAARLGIWELDTVTGQVNWDERCRELFGLAADNPLLYEQALLHIHADDRTRVDAAVKWAMNPQSGGNYDITYRTIGADDGLLRWVRFIGQSYFNEGGGIERFSGIAQDVTQDIEFQQLKTSESYFRQLTDTVPAIIWETDPVGYCTYLNKQWYDTTGQTQTEAEGFGWLNATHPDDKAEAGRLFREANEKQLSFNLLYRLRQKDGSYRWAIDQGSPRFTMAGKYEGMIGTVVDVHDQKLAEEEKQKLIAILETSHEFVGLVGLDTAVQYLNPAALAMLGWDSIESKTILDCVYPEDRTAAENLLATLNEKGHFSQEIRLMNARTGQLFWVQWNAVAIKNASSDEIIGLATVSPNITERKKAEQALAESEAKLRSIIATAPAAIGLFVGRDLIVEMPNQTFIDIVGKGPDIVGKPLREVMPELESQPFLQILDDVYTSGKMFQSFGSQVNIVQQGVMTHNFYNITYTPLVNTEGQVYAILDIAIDVTERVLAQQRIEESRRQVLESFEQSPVGIAIIGEENLTFRMANSFYCQLIGRTPDKLIDKPLLEAIPELRGQGFDVLLKEVFATGIPFTAKEVGADIVHSNQLEKIYVDFTYQPQRGADDHISSILVVAIDVTQQVKTRQKIQESEARFRSLIEEAPVATCLFVGRDMTIEIANEPMISFWGKGRSVIGQPLAEALPELEGQPFLPLLDELFRTGKTYDAKAARADLVVDGVLSAYYFDYTYKPLRNAAGEVYAIMNMAVDVTEQVLARQELEANHRRFRTLLEAIPQMAWTNTPDGDVDFYNQRWYDYTGLNFEQTRDWGWEAVVYPDDLPRTVANYRQALATGTEYIVENRYKRSDGQYRWHLNRARPLRNEAGQITQWVGTATDIQQQKELEADLEQQVEARTRQLQDSVQDLKRSNQNLQQFAYIASHDLQEPLRKIQSFSDLLKGQYADQLGEGVDHLQRMQAAASRMSTLIKDLLAYARISTQQDATVSVSLTEVVNTVLNDLELVIAETGAVLKIDPLPIVQGDKSQLGQLFQNLLNNALKFRRMDRSGFPVVPQIQVSCQTIAVSGLPPAVRPTRMAMTYHRIDVSDNGIGFEEKYVDRIFQVFQRLHGRNEFSGTGIGLAICEKVAANHGGAITATSQPNQGATFSVYLPN